MASVDTTYLLKQLEAEQGYVISVRKEVAAGGTLNLHVRNPSDSGFAAFVPLVNPTTKGEATFTVYDNFDSITDGTEVTIQNATLGSDNALPDSGPLEAYQDSTFTATTDSKHAGGVIGAGGGGPNALGGGLSWPPTRIEPGRQMVLELTNDDPDTAYDQDILLFALI